MWTFLQAATRLVEGGTVELTLDASCIPDEPEPITVSGTAQRYDTRCGDGDLLWMRGAPWLAHGPQRLILEALTDNEPEGDEVLELALPGGALHRLTIIDAQCADASPLHLGADPAANAAALASAAGPCVVLPPGTFPVPQLSADHLRPGTTVIGHDTTLVRAVELPPVRLTGDDGTGCPDTEEGLPGPRVAELLYEGQLDSAPLVLRGLTLDGGNRQPLSPSSFHTHADVLFLGTRGAGPGHLEVVLDRVTLLGAHQDGLHLRRNVRGRACGLEVRDAARGGVSVTGLNNAFVFEDLTVAGDHQAFGFHVETDRDALGWPGEHPTTPWCHADGPPPGHVVGRTGSCLHIDGGDINGGLDLGATDGTVIRVQDVVDRHPRFALTARDSSVWIENSHLTIGHSDGALAQGRLLRPRDVRITGGSITVVDTCAERPQRLKALREETKAGCGRVPQCSGQPPVPVDVCAAPLHEGEAPGPWSVVLDGVDLETAGERIRTDGPGCVPVSRDVVRPPARESPERSLRAAPQQPSLRER